ncbi:hypothetical protein Pint_31379 [Pistacia integerrima]|uniref:Uncharacterized protein n=1 Tax=Pistacia integerrima TaxID=434235 RepID=A0ACC0XN79_9ROSI|nr:hypothetical protein Pint_31379 [Pistacia integerrima]
MASKVAVTSTAFLLFSTLLISLIPSSSATGICPVSVTALVSACVNFGLFKPTPTCCSLLSGLAEVDVGVCLCNLLGLGILKVDITVILGLIAASCPNVYAPPNYSCY